MLDVDQLHVHLEFADRITAYFEFTAFLLLHVRQLVLIAGRHFAKNLALTRIL